MTAKKSIKKIESSKKNSNTSKLIDKEKKSITKTKNNKSDSKIKKIDVDSKINKGLKTEKISKNKETSKEHNKKSVKESISPQPTLNIGLVGHVDHGKTTLTERLSGKWTDTHSEELERGITIRLGYADTIFYKIPGKKGFEAWSTKAKDSETGKDNIPIRKVSFVDAPGHEALMATMLAGTTIMDGALLLVAANEPCPRPQTREHVMALQMAGVKNIIVVQNKIDLVSQERAIKNYKQIKDFLKNTDYTDAPIIPISAQRGVNINLLIDAIQKFIPTIERDPKADPLMLVARSFDINKPGSTPDKLKGGVLGGSLKQGVIKTGMDVEIRPGRIFEEANKIKAEPLFTTIIGVVTGGITVEEIHPGGSVALMTTLDPSIVKSDSLTGNVVGIPEKLPPIWYDLKLNVHLLKRVVGSDEDLKVNPLMKNELLMLNVNSAATVGVIREIKKDSILFELKKPICASLGVRVTISRRIGTRFRLIGYGEIL